MHKVVTNIGNHLFCEQQQIDSYCDLEEVIAVEIYGRTLSTELKLIIIVGFILTTAASLAVSYSLYYYKQRNLKGKKES